MLEKRQFRQSVSSGSMLPAGVFGIILAQSCLLVEEDLAPYFTIHKRLTNSGSVGCSVPQVGVIARRSS